MQTQPSKNVLVAPLDWGLGHATRCIPIIEQLIRQNCVVFAAANNQLRAVLEQSFPQIQFLSIPDYRVQYGKTRNKTILKIILQSRRIKKIIRQEWQWLDAVIDTHKIDLVISDNRYGLWNRKVKTVFITHQLRPKTFWHGFAESWLQKKLYRYINAFDICWVMDYAENPNLAGDLSHPKKLPAIPVQYIGAVSRFRQSETTEQYHFCMLLSGPEPQRSLLETQLITQASRLPVKSVLVRGLPKNANPLSQPVEGLDVYDFLHTPELNKIILQSRYIICRSGYSSVMDLLLLNKKCIFIPTPAQTEQEYLAKYLAGNQYCLFYKQEHFCLKKALEEAENFSFRNFISNTHTSLAQTIENSIHFLCK